MPSLRGRSIDVAFSIRNGLPEENQEHDIAAALLNRTNVFVAYLHSRLTFASGTSLRFCCECRCLLANVINEWNSLGLGLGN